MKKAFTILEVLIVVIVMGILVAFVMPQYAKIKEKALDNEAKGYLVTILAAEKVFKTESGDFYDFTSATKIDDINDALNINLPVGSISPGEGKWHYSTKSDTITDSTGATIKRLYVTAQRNLAEKRCWQICSYKKKSTDPDEPQEVKCST